MGSDEVTPGASGGRPLASRRRGAADAPDGRGANAPDPAAPEPPEEMRRQHGDWSWELAYQAVPQVATWRLSDRGGRIRYLKVAEAAWHPSLREEIRRMEWAGAWLPVPEVLESGTEGGVDWVLTRALPGVPATDGSLTSDPARLVPLLAEGLRRFHRAPAERCPFDFRLDRALEVAREGLERGLVDPDRDFHAEFVHLTAEAAVATLEADRPAAEDLVVCHGDYCLPNVLIDDGRAAGFVDLGELGVADRWWDLAVATWSLDWNLEPGWQGDFLEAYGVEPDPERTRYFRLLYDLVS